MKNNPNHVCVKCDKRFAESVSPTKHYCDSCMKIHLVEKRKIMYNKSVYKKTLRKFYDFQRIQHI